MHAIFWHLCFGRTSKPTVAPASPCLGEELPELLRRAANRRTSVIADDCHLQAQQLFVSKSLQ